MSNTYDVRERLPERGLSVVLLGTQGGPIPGRRAGVATAIIVDGSIYLVDAGSGLPLRFAESGLTFEKVRGMFITHLHSDHVADMFNFFSLNWTNWSFETQVIELFGPGPADQLNARGDLAGALPLNGKEPVVGRYGPTPGVRELFNLSVDANAYDINERIKSTRRTHDAPLDFTGNIGPGMVRINEIEFSRRGTVDMPDPSMNPEEVYADEHVKVTATLVHHPPVFPAFAYRFDTRYGSIVVSGDTSPCQNLISLSQGASLLVNEVMAIEEACEVFENAAIADQMRKQFSTAHTPMRTTRGCEGQITRMGVGELARRAQVNELALTHIYPTDGQVTDEEFRISAQTDFKGPVHVGQDFMLIELG